MLQLLVEMDTAEEQHETVQKLWDKYLIGKGTRNMCAGMTRRYIIGRAENLLDTAHIGVDILGPDSVLNVQRRQHTNAKACAGDLTLWRMEERSLDEIEETTERERGSCGPG